MTFNSTAVFPFRPNFIQPKQGEVSDFTYESQGIGKFTPWKVTSGPRRTITYPFLLETKAQIKQFRLFINSTRGAQRTFWLPLYLNDYRLTADASTGATTLTVEKINLTSAMSFSQFGFLALLTRDGLECHGITAVVAAGAIETITLTEPLEADIDANVTVCCGLLMARIDKEPVKYSYVSDGIATVNQTFIECPQEYVTPHLGSAPALLYRFSRSGTEWRYAGWGVDVTADGVSWTAADISSSQIKSGTDFLSDPIDLMVGTDDPDHPLRYYKDRTAMEQTMIEIRRIDLDTESDSTLLHKGTVEDASADKVGVIKCTVSSIFRIGEQTAPRIQHIRLCNHRLFDPGCGLNAGSYQISATLSAVTASYVQAPEFAAEATARGSPSWFALGRVMIGTETRLVTGQSADKLFINAPFNAAVAAGASASARPGCDKRINGGCAKFGNQANFLGFPFTPNNSPQLEALITPKPKAGKKDSGTASTDPVLIPYNAP